MPRTNACAKMSSVKRKCFTIEEKISIIHRLEAGESNIILAKEFGVSHSTISSIKKHKHKIEPLFNANVLKPKRVRASTQEKVEQALLKWFKLHRNRGMPVNGPLLQEKANFFARELNIPNFHCSMSWINRFKVRHNITASKIAGTLPVDSSGIDNLDLSMDVLKRPIKTYGKKVRVSPINSPDDLSQDPAPSTSHCYMETKNFASPLSDLSLRDYGTTEIKTEIKIEEILPPKYPKITQSSEHDEETPLTAELKHEGNVHMSPINSPDDLSRDPAPSTSHCYMESKNFDSPFSDSSFCDYDTTEMKTEIKIEEEEIVLPKYPDNCNQSLEHDEESPPYAKLKDELRRLSDLCAKQKQMLEQSTEIRPQIKIENQHLTQVQALNNIPSEVNATENCATKSSHLIKKQISKRRRSTFKKTQAPAPAGSLQFTLKFSSKNTYEYIKRARDFRLNVNGFSAGFRKISKTHREQYHTC